MAKDDAIQMQGEVLENLPMLLLKLSWKTDTWF